MTVRLYILTISIATLFLVPCSSAQRIEFGASAGYEYGSRLPLMEGYEPYSKNRTSLYTVEAFVGISLGILNVYPSWSYSIAPRNALVSNRSGDYIPEGYGLSRDASNQSPGVLYGDNYYDLSSEVDFRQTSAGGYLLLPLGQGLEIGTGYFQRRDLSYVSSEVLYDEYYYDYTEDGKDYYSYSDTYRDHVAVEKHVASHDAVPLVVQWRIEADGGSYGTQIAYWKSDLGRSIGIKYFMTFPF